MMNLCHIVALLAFISEGTNAGHDDLPYCASLGISDDASCQSYCGSIGHDDITSSSGIGSQYWSDEDHSGHFGIGCKCKTSPPGAEYDYSDYDTVCYKPPGDKTDEVEEDASIELKESVQEVEVECDKGCSNGSTRRYSTTMISLAAGAILIPNFAGLN